MPSPRRLAGRGAVYPVPHPQSEDGGGGGDEGDGAATGRAGTRTALHARVVLCCPAALTDRMQTVALKAAPLA